MTRPALALVLLSSLACTPVPSAVESPDPDPDPDPNSNSNSDSPTTPTSPPATAELPSEYRFAFVTFGGEHPRQFAEAVDKGGPAVLAHLWSNDGWPEAIVPLVDRTFGSEQKRWHRAEEQGIDNLSAPVDPDELAALGFEAPREPLWLVGPAGPCHARVEGPMLAWYTWGLDAIELSWRLTIDDPRPGCDLTDPSQWSQIAIFAESLPEGLRYVAAEQVAGARVELATWASPYAELIRATIASERNIRIDEVHVREAAVPGTALVELTVALIQRDRSTPREPCMDYQRNVVLVGTLRDGIFSRYALDTEGGRVDEWTELRGAFVLGSEIVWTVHESWGQAYVNAPARAPSTVEVAVASFHPESFGEPPFTQVEYCGP